MGECVRAYRSVKMCHFLHSSVILGALAWYVVSGDDTAGTAILTARDGGHHHPHPAPSPSYSRASSCSPPVDTSKMLTAVGDLDYQLHSTLRQLPLAITDAKAAIEQGTADSNRDKLITGLACLIAAISGKLGVLYNKDPLALSVGDQLSFAAQTSWGYGYWGPFLLDLNDAEPGCGVEDFNRVLAEYSFITSLHQTYGSDISTGGYASGQADDRPELRAYYLAEFGRKMKLELHCITSQAGSSSEASKVVNLIDKYVKMGQERLELTADLM